MRFAERDKHQIFIEPESLDSNEMYINGVSSSLPEDVQDAFLRTIPGFEHAKVTRPGYAVEYDFIEPTQLYPSLETKKWWVFFLPVKPMALQAMKKLQARFGCWGECSFARKGYAKAGRI